MRVIEGARYVVIPDENTCYVCLQKQVRDTDSFVFRTGNPLKTVHPSTANPFFAQALETAQECFFAHGISISKNSLATRAAHSTCRHMHADEQQCSQVSGYRARSLKDFFRTTKEINFVSPVHATIGMNIYHDLKGLGTAKSSGFMIRYRGSDSFMRPWGGHCENFNDAARLGILEGIERIECESAPNAPYSISDKAEKIGLDQFGLDIGPWKIPNPKVGAWSPGRFLDDRTSSFLGSEVALPERLVYYAPTVDTSQWVQDSSNGCALGGSEPEAILFGLLEVIERDAFLAAWYGGLDLVPIDLKTVQNRVSQSYLQRLSLSGVEVTLLNATIGVQIPTVIAVCEEPGGSTCVGAGSHPDPERALKSALIEVASDFQVAAAHREQRAAELDAMLADYSLVQVMEDHADMFASPDARPLIARWRHPNKVPVPITALKRTEIYGKSVKEDLRFSIQQCQNAGFKPIACDLTDGLARTVGAHVWKVVIPGLIPLDFGCYQRVYSMSRLEKVVRSFGDLPASSQFYPVMIPHPFP